MLTDQGAGTCPHRPLHSTRLWPASAPNPVPIKPSEAAGLAVWLLCTLGRGTQQAPEGSAALMLEPLAQGPPKHEVAKR